MSQAAMYFFDRLLIVLVIAAVIYSAFHILDKPAGEIHIHNYLPTPKKDSSIVLKEIPGITIINKTYPDKVQVQEKPDTSLRNKAQKGTIIIGEQVKNGELIVQKIDTSGKKVQDKYNVNESESFQVDKNGNVQISEDKKKERKEKLKKVLTRVLEGALFVGGIIIGKKL